VTLAEVALAEVYAAQLQLTPDDTYLRQHSDPRFLAGTVRVFDFYEPFLPQSGRILDWGCRHAPDACLLRARHPDVEIDGCDVHAPGAYGAFYACAGLRYGQLDHLFRLPYADASFDAVIASGVLEHVAMDYESLKELHRVLRPGGRLIVTYLPNRGSIEEWRLRRKDAPSHARLYSRREFRDLLLHSGFLPLTLGYQTLLDLLPRSGALAGLLRPLGLARFTSCLCAVASRVTSL
jgi:SAM-dependent methyltransferase